MTSSSKNLKWYLSNCCWWMMQRFLPAKVYLSFRYRLLFGRWINWNNPIAFTEKLQWLKVNYYGKKEASLVDKIQVKQYVREKVGERYVLPTIGVWTNVEDIPFETLPDECVLKCNHDSGSIVFLNKTSRGDLQEAKSKLAKALQTNYYWTGCETPYKYIEPKIFAEPRLVNKNGDDLYDYKFFCFNGCPKIFKIDFNRFVDHHANYYDINGDILPFGEVTSPPSYEQKLQFPDNLSEMIEVARKLSQGLPFARVDFYNTDGRIILGEMTLFPTSGFGRFTSDEWDERLGSWMTLPPQKTKIV